MARGIDDSPVETAWERKSLSRERTFQVDLRRAATVRSVVARLAGAVAHDLRSEGLQGATITLKVRFAPFTTVTRSETLRAPTDDPAILSEAALRLLERIPLDRPVRLLGVRVAKLASRPQRGPDVVPLFDAP